MSNYYSMRDGKAKIAEALLERGWEVQGYSAAYMDQDMGSDYPYHAAHWSGLATKNGFILVVDIDNDAESKEIKQYNPKGNLSFEDREKITKLEAMTVNNGCTEGEEENAKSLIEKIQSKTIGESSYEVVGMTLAHMGNPKGSKWHIEKDGKIYDKGTGITKYSDLPSSYEFDMNKMEYTDRYKKVWTNSDEYGNRIMEDRKLSDELKKVINDFKSLILRLERVVNGANTMGDGTKETEQKAQDQQVEQGFEKVTVTETKTSLKMVEVDRKNIQVGDYIKVSHHACYWKVISEHMQKGTWSGVKTEKLAFTYEQVGKESRGYQSLKNAQRYYDYEFRMLKDIENGKTKIYELKEVTESIEIEKWVKIDKTKKTNNTKAEKVQAKNEEQPIKTTTSEIINHEITITSDIDTRDNSALWVVKIIDKLSNEEYKKVAEQFKGLKGYYSKFKHGFIFKYDPTSVLKSSTEQQAENTTSETDSSNYNEVAENLIDNATSFIDNLGITGTEALSNEQYKRMLEQYINNNNINIDSIMPYLKQNEYTNLVTILEEITSPYWQPEIQDGFIYECHFKEWDLSITQIQKSCSDLNIPFIDMGDKIGFEGLTAEQTRQVKEISDANRSIFFIDSKEKEKEKHPATININHKINSIELKFITEPNEQFKRELKEQGFRFAQVNNLWYILNTEKNLQRVYNITGESLEQFKEAI